MSGWWEEIALGVIQGLTEFLPVSSSGHLAAVKNLLGREDIGSLALEIFLHFGTLCAVAIVFRRELLEVARGLFEGGRGRLRFFHVLLGAIPAGGVGILVRGQIESLGQDWPYVVPVCWLVTAGALLTLSRPRRGEGLPIDARAALFIGAFQVLALLPGISRSGITIAAALWIRRRSDEAASFSFLIAFPLILGATILEIVEISSHGIATETILRHLVGGMVAAVTGGFALVLLLSMLRRGTFHRWAYYLVPVALGYSAWLFLRGSES